jgi:hypothetical protein
MWSENVGFAPNGDRPADIARRRLRGHDRTHALQQTRPEMAARRSKPLAAGQETPGLHAQPFGVSINASGERHTGNPG